MQRYLIDIAHACIKCEEDYTFMDKLIDILFSPLDFIGGNDTSIELILSFIFFFLFFYIFKYLIEYIKKEAEKSNKQNKRLKYIGLNIVKILSIVIVGIYIFIFLFYYLWSTIIDLLEDILFEYDFLLITFNIFYFIGIIIIYILFYKKVIKS